MKEHSTVYHYIDSKKQFAMTLFDGRQFLRSLLGWPNFTPRRIKKYSELILGSQSISALLKNNENFGIYITSDDKQNPFRMNLETRANGHSRLFIKSNESHDKEHFTGLCKFVKFSHRDRNPYTTLLRFEKADSSEIIPKVLSQSYQLDAKLLNYPEQGFSFLITKFPDTQGQLQDYVPSTEKFDFIVHQFFEEIGEEEKIKSVEKAGFTFLSLKRMQLKCTCSKDKVIRTFRNLGPEQKAEIFQDDITIDVKCDYCQKNFEINKEMLLLQ